MVLPDKHKPDSDTVLWMNDVHATKEEAQQAGAVVALARVSTTLPLERLLPSQFIPTWTRALEVCVCVCVRACTTSLLHAQLPPGRGQRLAGVSTRPAGLPHPWGGGMETQFSSGQHEGWAATCVSVGREEA